MFKKELEKDIGKSLLTDLLINRGLTTTDAAQAFINQKYDNLKNPNYVLANLDNAVKLIVPYLRKGKRIVIFGDYDADGVCSTALLYELFSKFGAQVFTILPDREKDGYGLQINSVKKLLEFKPDLVITVDNGISSYEAFSILKRHKISTLIIDHHEPLQKIPPANVILNPKINNQRGSILCAAGLAYRVVEAIYKVKKVSPGQEKWFLDLAAIATVCDLVPLKNENRSLVYFGLKTLQKTRREGLKSLLKKIGSPDIIDADVIGYRLGPRLNATGRIKQAQSALNLVLAQNQSQADFYSQILEKTNRERQVIVREVYDQAKKEALAESDQPSLVLANPSWPKGVCGLVAGRLAEEFNRPVFILEEAENATGSGRSVGDFNLAQGLKKLEDLFIRAGGHALAAGCTLKKDKIDDFKRRLKELVREKRGDIIPAKVINYEKDLFLQDVNIKTLDLIKQLEPFGQTNPRPIFRFFNCRIQDLRFVGEKNNHVILKIEQGGSYRRAVAFNQAVKFNQIKTGDRIDLLSELKENIWQGTSSAELNIIDVKLSNAD